MLEALVQEIVEQLEATLEFRGVEEVLAANGK